MIINEQELLEDTAEGLGQLLDITTQEAKLLLTADDMDWILDEMFEAQGRCIQTIATELKD